MVFLFPNSVASNPLYQRLIPCPFNRFNLPSMQSTLGSERSSQIIGSLHAILKPFLLRRLKSDVEANLPPKKEYVLYAPLSMQQREAYNRVLDGTIRQYLIGEEYRRGDDPDTGKVVTEARSDEEPLAEKKPKKSGKAKDREVIVLSSDSESDEPLAAKSSSKNKNKNTSPRKPVTRRALRNRGAKRRIYNVDGSDDEYFARLENGEIDEYGRTKKELEEEEKEKEIGLKELARQHQRKAVGKSSTAFNHLPPCSPVSAVTKVNNMKLQNTVMQLRKVCSHPFLFDWPVNPETREYILDDQLVNASGKMMVLDRLLRELFKRKHKVLIFSQFTTMLDIIEVCFPAITLFASVFTRTCRNGRQSLWVGTSAASTVHLPRWNAVRRWSGSKQAVTRPTHQIYFC